MPGDACAVCGNCRAKEPQLSFHRFPSNADKRALWLQVFQLTEEQLKPHYRVCSRHFPDADPKKKPNVWLGKRFASPVKRDAPRTKRAKVRQQNKALEDSLAVTILPPPALLSSPALPSSPSPAPPSSPPPAPSFTALPGEQLADKYQVIELPDVNGDTTETKPETTTDRPTVSGSEEIFSAGLQLHIEALQAENKMLKKRLATACKEGSEFGMDHIKHDDHLVAFYTGFKSYMVFLAFFQFLGPAVDKLNYWNTKGHTQQRRSKKLGPMDQLLMTLMKLKLNLRVVDLSFRFKVSTGTVSNYITTWLCFLYCHLKEVDWMPSVKQVVGTLPPSFRAQYPSTYAIIDGSELFIETPSDLHMQSSTWSSYKHHNTAKFLIACTPNGCISFISPLYVGSISDVELTRVSGFLDCIKDRPGISIMADRGFTIQEMLRKIGVELNIPPFLEGRQQLPAKEIQEGRRIASLRIHVERAIGRIKTFTILKETLPITFARLSNQIVCVCAYLSNFKPVLIPPDSQTAKQTAADSEVQVDDYLAGLSDCDGSGEEYIDSD